MSTHIIGVSTTVIVLDDVIVGAPVDTVVSLAVENSSPESTHNTVV